MNRRGPVLALKDARFRIKAKKAPGLAAKFGVAARPKTAAFDARQAIKARKVTNRTIPNKSSVTVKRLNGTLKKTLVTKATISKPHPSGQSIQNVGKPTLTRLIKNELSNTNVVPKISNAFISVTGNSRVLQNKVTIQETGLKIAVRNDMLTTPSKNSARNPPFKQKPRPLMTIKTSPKIVSNEELEAVNEAPAPITRTIQGNRNAKPKKSGMYAPRLQQRLRAPRPAPVASSSTFHEHDNRVNDEVVLLEEDSTRPRSLLDRKAAPRFNRNLRQEQVTRQATQQLSNHLQNRARGLAQKKPPPKVAQKATAAEHEVGAPAGPSPFEGTKILVSNLHPVVIEEDILELFSVLGPVRRARLIGPGKAEVVFIRRDDAITAYRKYNNRDLDGQPMRMHLSLNAEANPGQTYSWMRDIGVRSRHGAAATGVDTLELEPNTLQRALFKGGSTGTSARPVVFTVKI